MREYSLVPGITQSETGYFSPLAKIFGFLGLRGVGAILRILLYFGSPFCVVSVCIVVTQKATWVFQRLAEGAAPAPHPECHHIL